MADGLVEDTDLGSAVEWEEMLQMGCLRKELANAC